MELAQNSTCKLSKDLARSKNLTMTETKVLSINEAMEIAQEIPEIFAALLDLYDADVEWVEMGVEGDQIIVRPVEKSNPTVSSVHVPSTDWNRDKWLVSKSIDEEKRYTLAPWYVPDSVDAHGEWTDKEEVQRAFWDYLKKPDRSIRLQHNMDIVAGEWVEGLTWPHEIEVPVKHPEGDRTIKFPAGTPFLGVIWEPWAWELIKEGEIRGLSIGGKGKRVEQDPEDYEYDPMGKVSFAKMIRTVNGKYVVYSEDGSRRFGTYDSKEQAEERLRQIEYFGKADFKVGDFVQWNASGGTARGQIERIETDGKINVPDSSFEITGTTEEPAALISVWREGADGWEITDRLVGHKLDTLSPIADLKKAETFRPPQAVQANAKRALGWLKEGLAGSGFTDVGRRRASQLANNQPVSLETIKRIYSYLSRHESDARAKGFERGEKGYPSAGRVAWDAWGGDEALAWSRSIAERFEKHLQGQHDQSSHARGRAKTPEYSKLRERREKLMTGAGELPALRRDKNGRVINENATGGYLANIPEKITVEGIRDELTPETSLWHHMVPDGEGGYRVSDERAMLHKKAITTELDGVASTTEPTFYMLGGGSGAGKSRITESGITSIPSKASGEAVFVNADDMKAALPEYNRMRMSNDDADFFNAAAFGHVESSYLADQTRKAAFVQNKNIVLDGTGNGKWEDFSDKISTAKNAGYKIDAVYVTVPTDMAVTRAFNRSLKIDERRFVPESITRGTHKKASATFEKAQAAGIFDSFTVWSTETGSAIKLAEGTGKNITIIDNDNYAAFLAKGNE